MLWHTDADANFRVRGGQAILAATLLAFLCVRQAEAAEAPKLRDIKPLVLNLNPKPSVFERYVGSQADLDADPQASQLDLVASAQEFFETWLRPSLDQNAKANIAW